MKPNIIVIIAARGGSKGFKDKNIRVVGGKPLIWYTIKQALAWGKAKRVVATTESEEIMAIAKEAGADVPFRRPLELATDTAYKNVAVRHAVLTCEELYHERYDIVVDLSVTSPVRTVKDLDNCLSLFLQHKPKTLFSVVRAHHNPYFTMVEEHSGGKAVLSKKLSQVITRRQDAPTVYALNGSIYFYSRNYIESFESPTPFSDDARIYVMKDTAEVDIDRELDFRFLEFLIKEDVVAL